MRESCRHDFARCSRGKGIRSNSRCIVLRRYHPDTGQPQRCNVTAQQSRRASCHGKHRHCAVFPCLRTFVHRAKRSGRHCVSIPGDALRQVRLRKLARGLASGHCAAYSGTARHARLGSMVSEGGCRLRPCARQCALPSASTARPFGRFHGAQWASASTTGDPPAWRSNRRHYAPSRRRNSSRRLPRSSRGNPRDEAAPGSRILKIANRRSA